MNNALYLLLIFTVIPLAVIVIALMGRRALLLPRRLFPRLSADSAYALSVTVLASLGMGAVMFLALARAQG